MSDKNFQFFFGDAFYFYINCEKKKYEKFRVQVNISSGMLEDNKTKQQKKKYFISLLFFFQIMIICFTT